MTARVAGAGVGVADVGGEELDEASGSLVAGVADQGWEARSRHPRRQADDGEIAHRPSMLLAEIQRDVTGSW